MGVLVGACGPFVIDGDCDGFGGIGLVACAAAWELLCMWRAPPQKKQKTVTWPFPEATDKLACSRDRAARPGALAKLAAPTRRFGDRDKGRAALEPLRGLLLHGYAVYWTHGRVFGRSSLVAPAFR